MTDAPISPDEVRALVRLLDDPNATVQASVRERLDELGPEAVPHLLAARDEADEALRPLIDEAIHDVHFDRVRRAWSLVMGAPEVDLERGAFLIAFYRFPDLDIPAYRAKLDAWAEQARPSVTQAKGVERAFALAAFMCDTLGFSGNDEHYYDPNNSYLNRVIDTRLGIPISLSVVYLLLGRRLGLPVYGVNMPAHFLVKHVDGRGEAYLDLFDGGNYVSKEACVRFLLKAGIKPRPVYFEAAEPRDILLRMADDLMRLLAPWDPSLEEDDAS